jgi:hypothetical protein
MKKILLTILILVGVVIINVATMMAYYWYLPLGVGLDIVCGYLYIKEKRRTREAISQ